MNNLKKQHRGSVETLALSAYGDEVIITEITDHINNHTKKQPYVRNTLIRIKLLLDDYLKDEPILKGRYGNN